MHAHTQRHKLAHTHVRVHAQDACTCVPAPLCEFEWVFNEHICAVCLMRVLCIRVNVSVLDDLSYLYVWICGYAVWMSLPMHHSSAEQVHHPIPPPNNCHLHSKWEPWWFQPLSTFCSVIGVRSDMVSVWCCTLPASPAFKLYLCC